MPQHFSLLSQRRIVCGIDAQERKQDQNDRLVWERATVEWQVSAKNEDDPISGDN